MSKAIRINHPGAGEWIMEQTGGTFRADIDHSVANYDDDMLLGGFVFNTYYGNSIAVHNAGTSPRWCSRDLMWMVFHYAFRQLHCGKLLAPVASDNHHALALNLRAGFSLETTIRDVVRPGCHLMILTMVETDCRWLRIIPQQYLPGGVAWKKGNDDGW